jgi:dihydropyrimidine dehydrogenase (NAD+) subunit PreA
MDLSVKFAGLEFRNPVLASAGPLTETYEKIERCIEAGIGGIVAKTIRDEPQNTFPRPRLRAYESRPKKFPLLGLQNIDGYSEFPIGVWKGWLVKLKREYPSIPLIASITSSDPKKLAELAVQAESFGVDGIQLDLSCPHHFLQGTGTASTNTDLTKLYVETVRARVKVPIIQKLTYNVVDIAAIAKASVEAGIDGLVAIDTVRSLIGIDIEKGEPVLPVFGGLSGGAIKPFALFSVANVAKTVTVPISASGGILNWEDAVEFMMAGATTVQLCTAVMWGGYRVIREITDGIAHFMEEKAYERPSDLIGLALPGLRQTVSDVVSRPPFEISVNEESCAKNCHRCVDACMAAGFAAILREPKTAVIDLKKCDGCGLCVGVCPTNSIVLRVQPKEY